MMWHKTAALVRKCRHFAPLLLLLLLPSRVVAPYFRISIQAAATADADNYHTVSAVAVQMY